MRIDIPNAGFVELADVKADDLSVVNAARVSFNQEDQLHYGECLSVKSDADCTCEYLSYPEGVYPSVLSFKSDKVLKFLMKERHGTPFEHNFFSFRVKVPLYVSKEFMRHRTGWSYNEQSARYSEIPDEFYVPEPDNIRQQVGRPGRYRFEPIEDEAVVEDIRATITANSIACFNQYRQAIEKGLAKEVARTFLPENRYTTFIASCNARSLMHFLGLRNHPQALLEIRLVAQAMERIFVEHMPVTASAFIENERRAP